MNSQPLNNQCSRGNTIYPYLRTDISHENSKNQRKIPSVNEFIQFSGTPQQSIIQNHQVISLNKKEKLTQTIIPNSSTASKINDDTLNLFSSISSGVENEKNNLNPIDLYTPLYDNVVFYLKETIEILRNDKKELQKTGEKNLEMFIIKNNNLININESLINKNKKLIIRQKNLNSKNKELTAEIEKLKRKLIQTSWEQEKQKSEKKTKLIKNKNIDSLKKIEKSQKKISVQKTYIMSLEKPIDSNSNTLIPEKRNEKLKIDNKNNFLNDIQNLENINLKNDFNLFLLNKNFNNDFTSDFYVNLSHPIPPQNFDSNSLNLNNGENDQKKNLIETWLEEIDDEKK